MNLTFSSNGTNYTATAQDIFMDNGARKTFIRGGKQAGTYATAIPITDREWSRIKPQLNPVDYEAYYGRKPLVSGVNIFQIKQ